MFARLWQHQFGNDDRTIIIVLTAHAMKGDHEKCLLAGEDGILGKPTKPKTLFATIEEFLAPVQERDLPVPKLNITYDYHRPGTINGTHRR